MRSTTYPIQEEIDVSNRYICNSAGGLIAVPAQTEGVEAALNAYDQGKKGFLIADQMGSGKTLQAILFAKSLFHTREIDNIIVLTRASLCSMWNERLEASQISTGWIKKSPQMGGARGQMLPSAPSRAVVTNYSLAIRPAVLELLKFWCGPHSVLILDEAHAAKGTGWKPSKISQVIWGLGRGKVGLAELARFTLCLTGTPTPNGRASELHGFLSVAEGAPRSYYEYGVKYCGLEKQQVSMEQEAWIETGNTNMKEWREMADRVRIKRPVSAFVDLPPVSFTEHEVDATKAIAKAGADIDLAKIEAAIDRGSTPDFGEFSTVMEQIGVAKTAFAADLIHDLVEGGPLVIFVRHKAVMDALEKLLAKKCVGIVKMNALMNAEKRGEAVSRFQSGSKQAFLTTVGVASEGIDLTRASQAVMVEWDYSPGRLKQAVARIHRKGQEKHCVIHRLTMRDTIDDRLARIIKRKAKSIERQG